MFAYSDYTKRISKNLKYSIQINSINAITDLYLEIEKLMLKNDKDQFLYPLDGKR